MVLKKEQFLKIKEKLLSQLSNIPESSRKEIKEKIESMSPDQLEVFLGENLKMDKCLFCSIAEGTTESYKVYEDNNFVCVLNIRPLTKGHMLLIPKDHHFEKGVSKDFEIVQKRISNSLKAAFPKKSSLSIKEEEMFGHKYFSIIPYERDLPTGEISMEKEEFIELQEKLKKLIESEDVKNLENLEKVEVCQEDKLKKKEEIFKADNRIP